MTARTLLERSPAVAEALAAGRPVVDADFLMGGLVGAAQCFRNRSLFQKVRDAQRERESKDSWFGLCYQTNARQIDCSSYITDTIDTLAPTLNWGWEDANKSN